MYDETTRQQQPRSSSRNSTSSRRSPRRSLEIQPLQSQQPQVTDKKDKGKAPARDEAEFEQIIGDKNLAEGKKNLKHRDKNGKLFSISELNKIKSMSKNESENKLLKNVGIGEYQEAIKYLNEDRYKDWLNLSPGKRLFLKSLAVNMDNQKSRQIPSPAYSQGLSRQIQTDDTLSEEENKAKKQQRDKYIRDAFVNTLKERKLPDELKKTNEDREAESNSAKASEILTKIFLILQSGLKVYDAKEKKHIDYKEGDVAKALAHGGRVNIRIPQLKKDEKHTDLTDWIGITEEGEGKKSKPAKPVYPRTYATHHMNITKNKEQKPGTFKEEGGRVAAIKNLFKPSEKNYGLDLSAGGLGKKDINGDTIMPDGAHGHMFIGFTYPTKEKDGALQIGLETTAPNTDGIVGYKHNIFSTEATANPESSFYGDKKDKIGGGSLEDNQRLVDLDSFEGKTSEKTWLNYLKDVERDWKKLLEDTGDEAYKHLVNKVFDSPDPYEELVGERKYFGYKDSQELNKTS